jgi:GNAT superfamily N-acetyltransferase
LDSDISYADDNESSFCALWSRIHKKIDCIELFSNPKLGDDYFFNRLNISNQCDDVDDILNLIKHNYSFSLKNYYIHIICNNENSGMLNKCKFGTMKILNLDVNEYVTRMGKQIEVDFADKNDLNEWIDVFCSSFHSVSLRDEVTTIISKQLKKFTLLIANYHLNEKKHPAGCCLLYEKSEIIGLYCLGTTQHFRRKGIARELISKAAKMAKSKGYNSLIVQTLIEEGYEEFYKKIGFKPIFKKMLYTMNLN